MSEIQPAFDWLIPTTKELLRPEECARYLDRSLDFVDAMITEGKLEYMAPTGRQVERKRITRRSLLLLILEQFRADPDLWFERYADLLPRCTAPQLTRLITEATRLRSKKLTTL